MTMPSVLFVVPRFHTNLYFATRFLVEAGWRVSIFVEHISHNEDHSHVTPLLFNLPQDRGALARAFVDAAPDLVLLRRTKLLNRPIRWLALLARVPVWTYSLRPLTEARSLPNRIRKLSSGLPLRRVTPVPGLDPKATPDPAARLLPWPVMALGQTMPTADGAPLRVLCVAKLGQTRKNILPMLDALRPMGEAGQLHLTLVGTTGGGSPEQLEALRGRAGEPWLSLFERVPYADMATLHAQADVAILPARDEPLGFAPLESMAYGAVPFISTACGSAGYITDGKNGFRFDPDDMTPLVRHITELAQDRALLARMQTSVRDYAETELGRAKFLERMTALLPEKAPNV